MRRIQGLRKGPFTGLDFYIAGPSADYLATRAIQAEILTLGGSITHDWTIDVENPPSPDDDDGLATCAVNDVRGVEAADVVIATCGRDPGPLSPGSLVEVGAALALRKPVWIAADPIPFFGKLAIRKFRGVQEVIEAVRYIAKVETRALVLRTSFEDFTHAERVEPWSALDALATTAFRAARDRGFHDGIPPVTWSDSERAIPRALNVEKLATTLCLLHSEVSEALEALRDYKPGSGLSLGHTTSSETGKPEGFGIELADVQIRLLDLAGLLADGGFSLAKYARAKAAYNATRSHRHGGKAI